MEARIMSYADLEMNEKDHALIDQELKYLMEEAKKFHCVGANYLTGYNPANPSQVVSRFPYQSISEVISNLANAKFYQKEWARFHWSTRVGLMSNFKFHVVNNLHRLAAMIILETGKSRAEAKAEVQELIDMIKYYCFIYGENRGYEQTLQTEKIKHKGVERVADYTGLQPKPHGVFVLISPFNFPIVMIGGMAVGALLTGNAVVAKAAPETARSAWLLRRIFVESMPDDLKEMAEKIFSFVVCPEESFGDLICNSEWVDGLSFTGSTTVGYSLARRINRNRRWAIPVLVETGGKNPCIVTPEANLEDAAYGVAKSMVGAGGQKCSACSNLIIHKAVEGEFLPLLAEIIESMYVMGDPSLKEVSLGPLTRKEAQLRHNRCVAKAKKDGATIIRPRLKVAEMNPEGYYVDPIIVCNLPSNHRFFKKELFCSFLTVRSYRGGIDEALKMANDNDYGLTAGIFSQSEDEINYFLENMEAGVVYANRVGGATTGAWPGSQNFCGWKKSGWASSRGPCGPDYLLNFMKNQSQTVYRY